MPCSGSPVRDRRQLWPPLRLGAVVADDASEASNLSLDVYSGCGAVPRAVRQHNRRLAMTGFIDAHPMRSYLDELAGPL